MAEKRKSTTIVRTQSSQIRGRSENYDQNVRMYFAGVSRASNEEGGRICTYYKKYE